MLVLPILCYAAASWAAKLNQHQIRKLRSAQRQALLAITRAYRTTFNDALTVLAAQTPIHLVLQERIAIYQLRKNMEIKIGNLQHTPTSEPNNDRTTAQKQ